MLSSKKDGLRNGVRGVFTQKLKKEDISLGRKLRRSAGLVLRLVEHLGSDFSLEEINCRSESEIYLLVLAE